MNIVELSIKRPVFTWMLMGVFIIFGIIGFRKMGVSQLPDVDFPMVSVTATLQGAAPEVMESDIVDVLEQSLLAVQGIKNMTASIRSGSATVSLEFVLEKNIDTAVQEIQNKISEVLKKLPKDMDPPTVQKFNPEDQPILWLAVSSDKMSQQELMSYVRDEIKDLFQTIPGVADVFLGGYVDPNLMVWATAGKLEKYNLTADDLVNTIQFEHQELPSGRIEDGEKELNIRTMGEALTPADFGHLSINKRGGAPNYNPIPLNSVARIEFGLGDVRRKSRVNGKPAVGIGIRKQRGVNAVDVADAAKAQMLKLQPRLPAGAEMSIRFDSTKFIKDSIHELNFTLILSAILTALICWVFLGSWSATLNVVLAIPTSILGSFIVLYFLGFTLNTFTLLALSLAVGIVVDDAIMVLENIVRYRERGLAKRDAALRGGTEITFAAIAATSAIIAIFLPVAYMKGIVGKFFFQFGVTLSVAVLFSLVEALTLTPMRTSQFLNVEKRTSRFGKFVEAAFHKSADLYRQVLPHLLHNRWSVIGASVIFFGFTIFLGTKLKSEFVPPQDRGDMLIRIKAPEGSSLDYTDKKAAIVEKILASHKEVQGMFLSIGGFGGGEVNTAVAFTTLLPVNERPVDPQKGRPLSQQEIADIIRAEIKKVEGVEGFIQDLSLAGFSAKRGFPIEVSIRGNDWTVLSESSLKVVAAMKKSKNFNDVDSDFRASTEEVQVIPDREKARQLGVSTADIGRTLNILMGGVLAGRFSKDGHRYDVRIQIEKNERRNESIMKKLFVRNNRGELIRLSQVVRVERNAGPVQINRSNRSRVVSIYANLGKDTSQAAALAEVMELSAKILPAGYVAIPSGSAEAFKETGQSMIFALLMGIMVAYMILATQFNSFIHPVAVLLALPFSISGALIGLLLTHQSLNMYSAIGILLLMGIVKKNSILLVDFTNQTREQGKTIHESLIHACPIRLRPILMTSIATIVGALPAAFAFGPGAESRIPMAIAVIGGVIVSTFLTLFVVPCAYSLMTRGMRDEKLKSSVGVVRQTSDSPTPSMT